MKYLQSSKYLTVFGISGLLIVAAVANYDRFADEPLVIASPHRSLESTLVYRKVDLKFTLRNRGRDAVKVIGANDRCGPGGCSLTHGLPMLVPKNSSQEITMTFSQPPKSFRYVLELYTDHIQRLKIVLESQPTPQH